MTCFMFAQGASGLDLPLRINCGGPPYTSPTGASYERDLLYTAGLGFGFRGGSVEEFYIPIGGTDRDGLYFTERFGEFAYRFDVPAGTYCVTLHLVSKIHHGPGIGIFDVVSSGQTLFDDVDLFARGPRGYAQDVRTWITTDGAPLLLEFLPEAGHAEIAGLEIKETAQVDPSPDPPSNVTAWAAPGGIQIHWAPEVGPEVRSFEVLRTDLVENSFEPRLRHDNLASFHWDRSVIPGEGYRYRVAAVGRDGRKSDPVELEPVQARFLNDTELPTFRLDIEEEALRWMQESANSNRWSPASVSFPDGSEYDAEARFRGGVSRRLHKKSFKIRLQGGASFEGRTILNLMGKFDESMIRDALSYELFRRLGLSVPETSFGHLVFNGESYGVYSRVEQIDDEFLAARGLSGEGCLYEVEGGDMTVRDDLEDYKRLYDKKTGNEDDVGEIIRLVELVDLTPDDRFPDAVWEALDVEGFLDWYAASVLVANRDVIKENHYLYLPPGGRWKFLSWDNDLAFPSRRPADFPIDMGTEESEIPVPAGTNRLFTRILRVDGFRYLYERKLAQYMEDVFLPDLVAGLVDSLHDAVRGDALTDWYKLTWEDNEAFLEDTRWIKEFVQPRRDYVRSKLAELGRPAFGGVVINEIQAGYGDSWVELWNGGGESVQPADLILSGRPIPGGGWRLSGPAIPSGGFYVVGLNAAGPDFDDSIPFVIEDGSRSLSLFRDSGEEELIDVTIWPPYLQAGSFGRRREGEERWVWAALGTPGTSNSASPPAETASSLIAYPSPWRADLSVRWYQNVAGRCRLELFDVLGRRVAVLANESRAAGWNFLSWAAAREPLPSGFYFVRLSGSASGVHRVLRLR